MRLTQLVQISGANKTLRKPSAEQFQQVLDQVTAGAGYVPADGSQHCCGSVDGGGQCTLYNSEKQRCVVLGPNLEITPTMTCTLQTTGPELPAAPLMALTTARQVGLTETVEGATCKRCDRRNGLGQQLSCFWLTDVLKSLLEKNGYESTGVEYAVEPDACCSFWAREAVEKPVG